MLETERERSPLPAGAELQSGLYRVQRLLGEGGFALTYLAHQGKWNLTVCLKEYFPVGCERRPEGIRSISEQYDHRMTDGLKAFSDEAATLSRFNHPGIVRVLGTFDENGTSYIVQEVLEGMPLADGLALAGRMKEPVVLKVAQQLGQALLMVHGAGLVHSDLKPENIFLTREGRYVLLDFGLTRGFLSEEKASMGARGLSLGYAPPEQYAAGQNLTPATDVYAFAATLYSLFTGAPPPDARLRLQGQVLPLIQPINGSITPKVEKALQNALQLDAQRRTPGIRELLFQLGLDSTPKAISYRPPEFVKMASTSERPHIGGITALAVHSASRRLYSAGRDGWIKVWSWPDLQLLRSVEAHDKPISALAVSGEGNVLISGSDTGEIKLWDSIMLSGGHVLTQEDFRITQLKIKGDLMVAAFADGKCCLLGPSLPEPVRWQAHTGSANSVDFHPSGSFVATAGDDHAIRFWDVPEPQLISELKHHEKSVQSVEVSPDGISLLSASNDQSILFWDLTTNEIIRDLKGCHAVVLEACFTCRDQIVVSLSGDHFIRAFNLSSGRVAYCSQAHSEGTRALAVDSSEPLMAIGGGDAEIHVWGFPPLTDP